MNSGDSTIIAQSAQTLLARITDSAGNPLTATAVSTVSIKIFDRDTQLQVGTALDPSPSSVLSPALQTGSIWMQDNVGYNFSITIPGTYFPAGGTTYRVEVNITPVGGDPFFTIWNLQAIPVFS